MISKERILKAIEILNSSTTPIQHATRKETFARLMEYIRECDSDVDLFQKVVQDFPVFTLCFIDNLNGEPVFLAKWQIEAGIMLDEFSNVWFFVSRRGGKTLLMAAKQMQMACMKAGWRFLNFSPTAKQNYLFSNITRNFKNSDFLFKEFCGGKKDTVLKESVELTNKATFEYRNVGIQQQGELARGESANLVAIDEIQTIPARAFTSVIRPILSDNYGDKRMWMIGTPSLLYNPDLDTWWDTWNRCTEGHCEYKWQGTEKVCPDCGKTRIYATLRVDWGRAGEEGCLNIEKIKEDMAMMTTDEILMEYEALFPKEAGRFFSRRLLQQSFREYDMVTHPKGSHKYIMAVDWTKHRDKMQIIIGDVVGGEKISVVHHQEIDPENRAYSRDEMVAIVKEKFELFNPFWIICDSTGAQDLFINLLTIGDMKIPKSRFYAHNADKEEYGFIFSGPQNYDLYRNYKKLLESGNFVVPGGRIRDGIAGDDTHQKFRKQWIKEHHELEAKSAMAKGYLTFSKPKNGYDDMVQTCAMLAWHVRFSKPSPPLMIIKQFSQRKGGGKRR